MLEIASWSSCPLPSEGPQNVNAPTPDSALRFFERLKTPAAVLAFGVHAVKVMRSELLNRYPLLYAVEHTATVEDEKARRRADAKRAHRRNKRKGSTCWRAKHPKAK